MAHLKLSVITVTGQIYEKIVDAKDENDNPVEEPNDLKKMAKRFSEEIADVILDRDSALFLGDFDDSGSMTVFNTDNIIGVDFSLTDMDE